MAFKLPPPPTSEDLKSPAWRDWFFKLGQAFTQAGSVLWSAITLPTVSANQVLAGPPSGAAAQAAFRVLSTTDLGTGTANATTFLRGDLTWATTGGATLNNIISTPTTVAIDTSYAVISYLSIASDLTINGNVMVIG